MNDRQQITLAIESAIAGGSLSLVRGETEIGNWLGTADRSKAEELLVNINEMIEAAKVSPRDIDLIAVSAGPGSFTGIRIGIATALGLKTGLEIPMSSVSALEAMGRTAGRLPAVVNGADTQAGRQRSDITVAVPVGRDSVCIQSFNVGVEKVTALDAPRTIPETEIERITDPVILHGFLFEKYAMLPNAVDFGANIAYAVGLAASPGVVHEPLFISKSF